MQISTETFGNVLVAHTPDELSEDTAGLFLEALSGPINSGQKSLVLQMDRSELFDSMGLTALLDLQDDLREQGGQLALSGVADTGLRILEVTRLDKQFDIFESVIDAVSSMQ
jgi:anti-anti-sigma factor